MKRGWAPAILCLRMPPLGTPVCLSLLVTAILCGAAHAQDVRVLVDHLGYDAPSPKRAVVLARAEDVITAVSLLDARTGKEVLAIVPAKAGPVNRWGKGTFWTADFSSITAEGEYLLRATAATGETASQPFLIQKDILERNTLSNVIYYFKSQRCSGANDKADRSLRFDGADGATDLHGGWYDATGDYGKHLSHLSAGTYFNPQQVPLTAWALFRSAELLEERRDRNFRQFRKRLVDEALFGADYLVRCKNPAGSFYRSVDSPGGDKKPADRFVARELKSYITGSPELANSRDQGDTSKISPRFVFECGYRNGAGLAIAALSVAARCDATGDFASADYLRAARDAFAFLQKDNLAYTNDGKENIVDDYCVLLAATELFKTTRAAEYKAEADRRAALLVARLTGARGQTDYWRADDEDRPFFHPSDAGLPVVALIAYGEIAEPDARAKAIEATRRSLAHELAITGEVANPFGLARQFVQGTRSGRRASFFFPHDAETAPWWQGENARLASLAAAARMAAPLFGNDPEFQRRLAAYAGDQLHWILGRNPFDLCMLAGSGRGNASYLESGSYEYAPAPGGICNGITADDKDPLGLAFEHDWRWSEQWLPHSTWYLLAVSAPH